MERNGNYIGYIYCVTNTLNNKQYIGQTMRSIKRRWNAHKTESKTEDNPSYFQQYNDPSLSHPYKFPLAYAYHVWESKVLY